MALSRLSMSVASKMTQRQILFSVFLKLKLTVALPRQQAAVITLYLAEKCRFQPACLQQHQHCAACYQDQS